MERIIEKNTKKTRKKSPKSAQKCVILGDFFVEKYLKKQRE